MKKEVRAGEICVFCGLDKSAMKFKGKWVCHDCLADMLPLFRIDLKVRRIKQITDKIEKIIGDVLE